MKLWPKHHGLQLLALFVIIGALFIGIYGALIARTLLATATPKVSLLEWLNAQRAGAVDQSALNAYQSLPGGMTPLDSYPTDLFETPELRESVRAALTEFADGIARALEGTRRDRLGWRAIAPASGNDVPPRVLAAFIGPDYMPANALTRLRTTQRTFALAATMKAIDGDAAGAEEMLVASARVARQSVEESRTNLEKLIAFAVLDGVARGQRHIFERTDVKFSDEALARLDREFAAIPRERVAFDVEALRVTFDDLIGNLFTDDGTSDGHVTREGIILMKKAAIDADADDWRTSAPMLYTGLGLPSRAEATAAAKAQLDFLQAQARVPVLKRDDVLVADDKPLLGWIDEVMPNARIARSAMLADTALVGARLRIAILRYRLAHDADPTSLAELGALFPLTMLDPMDGAPIRVTRRGDRLVVYSIGGDGDDDGGRCGHDRNNKAMPDAAMSSFEPVDGDWILAGPWE